jgi:hypothetical protein
VRDDRRVRRADREALEVAAVVAPLAGRLRGARRVVGALPLEYAERGVVGRLPKSRPTR